MTTIYKVWLMKYQQSWYNLDKPKQDALMGKVAESLKQAGGKLLLSAASLWADEKWTGWGIEEYPDLEAVIKHAQTIWDLQWYRYIKSRSTLSTLMWPETQVIIPKAPIYRLVFFKMNEAWYRLSDSERAQWDEKNEQAYKQTGAQNVCVGNTTWCNEESNAWLLETYPSLEAMQMHVLQLFDQGWYQFASATSLLGVKYPPD